MFPQFQEIYEFTHRNHKHTKEKDIKSKHWQKDRMKPSKSSFGEINGVENMTEE